MQRLACTRLILAALFMLVQAFVAIQPARAQTFTVIHTFTGAADGASPFGSLALDGAGNLYGTASAGGFTGNNCTSAGCGTVFQLSHRGSGWIFSPLYSFKGGYDAATPYAGVTIGPNGSLYGTTLFGGHGLGTVFNLQPPAHASGHVFGGWTETVLYRFNFDDGNGYYPVYGNVVFDPAGNLYGTTYQGGLPCDDGSCGTVFKLTHSSRGWMISVYAFMGREDGGNPLSGVILDALGNLYGTTSNDSQYDPVVYELTPMGGGWTETPLYSFPLSSDLRGGVILDGLGGLLGTNTLDNTVYQLSPSSGQWTYSLLYTFSASSYLMGSLVRDANGNVYGTSCGGGTFGQGSVYKLTPSQSGWTETDLYDFTGGHDGSCPVAGVALDTVGNLYGTALGRGGSGCGGQGCGVVWEITP